MNLDRTVQLWIRAYALISITFGAMCILLAALLFILGVGPLNPVERYLFGSAYQLCFWAVVQLCFGIFLLAVRKFVSRLIVADSPNDT